MKKLITTVLSLSILSGIIPLYSSAKTFYVHNGLPPWSDTFVTGDINKDGSVSIGDAVILNEYIVNSYSEYFDIVRFDVNSDGYIDSFDLAYMKQLVLDPDSAMTAECAVDIITPSSPVPDGKIFSDKTAMTSYLSSFIEDETEIESYSEKYNDEFFKENNLILQAFLQERGRGIFYTVSGCGKTPDNKIRTVISSNYEEYRGLYPVTNTYLLIQTAVPKSQSSENDVPFLLDTTRNYPDVSSHKYSSPDGANEILITQESFMNVSDIRVYLKDSSISYSPLTSLTVENGGTPFNDNGNWYKDDDGNDVFGDGLHYNITWFDDSVIIEYEINEGVMDKVSLLLEPQTDPDQIR